MHDVMTDFIQSHLHSFPTRCLNLSISCHLIYFPYLLPNSSSATFTPTHIAVLLDANLQVMPFYFDFEHTFELFVLFEFGYSLPGSEVYHEANYEITNW